MSVILPAYKSSVCEIRNVFNQLAVTGYIIEIADKHMLVKIRSEHLALEEVKGTVKVTVCNNTLGLKVLLGNILEIDNGIVEIADLSILLDHDRRKYFRVDLEEIAYVRLKKINSEIFTAYLTNISLGGLYFKCEHEFSDSDELKVFFDNLYLDDPLMCKICRTETFKDEMYGYGCKFVNISQYQSDELCRYLFRKQGLMYKNMSY